MTADRLALLARRAAADHGDVQAQAAWLRARVQAGERGPVACGDCKGSKKGPWRELPRRVYTATVGRLCCCGVTDEDPGHGTFGIDDYEHGFVHACDYYETDCDCETEEVTRQRRMRTNDCAPCDGTGLAPFRRAVEIAAYCGDARAQAVVGRTGCAGYDGAYHVTCCSPTLSDWLRGLARWGDEVMVRAAVAAADSQCNMGCIDVVAENEQAIACARNAVGLASDWLVTRDPRHRDGWAQEKDRLLGSCVYAYVPHPDSNLVEWLVSHGRLIGKQPVREAIQRALIAWALQ